MASYRVKLDERAAALGPRPPEDQRWATPHSFEWFALDWNARRLAVFDRDVEAIIRTHARDRRVAAWLQDTAQALMEIGEVDAAIDWAKQATDFDNGHQARRAADYWCELLAEHRPDELLAARVDVFRRWPSSTTAGSLCRDAGAAWPDYRDEVFERLTPHPRDAVLFAQLSLKDIPLAWDLAHRLGLSDDGTWSALAKAYEKLDPIAVLPVYTDLVEGELANADAKNYRSAARRLKKMRKLAAGSMSPPRSTSSSPTSVRDTAAARGCNWSSTGPDCPDDAARIWISAGFLTCHGFGPVVPVHCCAQASRTG